MTSNIMDKISVVILTYNEEIHIERCIKSAKKYSNNIFVIDSYSTDKTVEISQSLNANILQNKFINYSKQFSWALNNIKFKTDWILRLDADEYLENDLILEINNKLPTLDKEIVGINFKRKHIFLNKWIKYGGRYPLILLRLWRNGHGYIENRWMDEHILIKNGKTTLFKNNFCDHNLNNLSFFTNKHDWYASREAIDILLEELNYNDNKDKLEKKNTSSNAFFKRTLKEKLYNNLPIGLRSSFYFIYRYFFLLGFLDGNKGFIYHFLQGFWYRVLVDSKLLEFKEAIKNLKDKKKILEKLSEVSKLKLN